MLVRPARRARLLHAAATSRRFFAHRLGGALQLQPHRRAADRAASPSGRAPTAARPACIRRTSTTTPTPSARSTSPATCRSSSAPTARASAASCARRRSRSAELWKIGQLRPGDTRALRAASRDARPTRARAAQERPIAGARPRPPRPALRRCRRATPCSRVCRRRASAARGVPAARATTTCSSSTARCVLDLRAAHPRARADELARGSSKLPGIVDLTPGIRSLQIHFDSRQLLRVDACSTRCSAPRRELPAIDDIDVPTPHRAPAAVVGRSRRRGWRSRSTCRSVRADAPWCPSNIEFIRRINGLDSIDEREATSCSTRATSCSASGDVYLGAPVATPARSAPSAGDHEVQPGAHLDAGERRRHRRRVPVHLRHGGSGRLPVRRPHGAGVEPLPRHRSASSPARRGCCASSTRSASIPVSATELLEHARRVPARQVRRPRSTTARSSCATTSAFLGRRSRAASRRSKARQQAAFEAERERWAASRAARVSQRTARRRARRRRAASATCPPAPRPSSRRCRGSVWQLARRAGASACTRGQTAADRRGDEDGGGSAIAPVDGVVSELSRCAEGRPVAPGQRVAVLAAGWQAWHRLSRVLAASIERLPRPARRCVSACDATASRPRAARPVWISPSASSDCWRSWHAARSRRAALRRAVRGEGQHRRGRAADDGGLPRLRVPARAHRARWSSGWSHAGAIVRRQDQPRPVRHRPGRHALAVRHLPLDLFDQRYISGGSSSGSAVAVAHGPGRLRARHRHRRLGSRAGRVQRHRRLKPTRGLLSTRGVVPGVPLARLRLDLHAQRGRRRRVSSRAGFDPDDPFSRERRGRLARRRAARLAVPRAEDLEFFGDLESAELFLAALDRAAAAVGAQIGRFDFAPFREAAALLYAGPWVAERTGSARAPRAHADAVHPVVRRHRRGGDEL